MSILPLDLAAHGPAVIALARMAFVESFGSLERFEAQHGPDGTGVLTELSGRQARHPWALWGAVEDGVLRGLLVLGSLDERPPIGHVVIISVVPEARGTGLGSALLAHAARTLAAAGFVRARLRAGERNRRALRFYLREGWSDVGPHPAVPGMRVLERALEPAAA